MFHTTRTRYVAIATLTIAGLITIGAAAALQQQKLTSQPTPTETQSGPAAPEAHRGNGSAKDTVSVRAFRLGDSSALVSAQSLTGTVRARYEHTGAFRVSGKIRKRHINVGDHVRPGDLLFELDPEDYQLQHKTALANVEVAKASVAQATAEERRLSELRKSNAVSASEHDRGLSDRDIAVGRLDAAQKQLELATNQLNYCELRSDVEGTIISVDVEAGQVVVPGMRLCATAQSGELEAVVDIPENRLTSYDPVLAKESTTDVSFWSMPELALRAKLRELSPTADPSTRTYRGRFTLLDPPPQVRLGMTVTVHLRQSASNPRFLIPSTAILRIDNQPAVWRIEPATGKITAVPVVIEEFQEDAVAVSGNLNTEDMVVSAGVQKLDPSLKVRIWEVQK